MRGRPYMPEEPEPEPNQLPGSCIAFTRNGKLQGVAYRCAACPSRGRPLYYIRNSKHVPSSRLSFLSSVLDVLDIFITIVMLSLLGESIGDSWRKMGGPASILQGLQ